MTTEQFNRLMERFDRFEKRLKQVERKFDILLKKYESLELPDRWIHEKEAMEISGYAKDTLKRKRAAGLVIWRAGKGNRKIEYLLSSIIGLKGSNESDLT